MTKGAASALMARAPFASAIRGECGRRVVVRREDFANEVRRSREILGGVLGRLAERNENGGRVRWDWLGPPLREQKGAYEVPDVVLKSRLELLERDAINARLSWFLYDTNTHFDPFREPKQRSRIIDASMN